MPGASTRATPRSRRRTSSGGPSRRHAEAAGAGERRPTDVRVQRQHHALIAGERSSPRRSPDRLVSLQAPGKSRRDRCCWAEIQNEVPSDARSPPPRAGPPEMLPYRGAARFRPDSRAVPKRRALRARARIRGACRRREHQFSKGGRRRPAVRGRGYQSIRSAKAGERRKQWSMRDRRQRSKLRRHAARLPPIRPTC